MFDPYEDIGEVMGSLEAYGDELGTMVLNGKNKKANRYLKEAINEIRHALSNMSDALFEITTEPVDFDDFEEDDGED